jgi:hypothetical protein
MKYGTGLHIRNGKSPEKKYSYVIIFLPLENGCINLNGKRIKGDT